nr:glycosyl hydrolase family 28-related protein [Woeseiaceae bacterium]
MKLNRLTLTPFLSFFAVSTVGVTSALAGNEPVPGSLPNILSQQTSGTERFLPDFSYAGYRNGAEELPVASGELILVEEFGAVANDEADDTRAIKAAIAKANETSGPVIVRFGAGRYRITEVLKIERSNIVLQGQGSGPGGTTLFF